MGEYVMGRTDYDQPFGLSSTMSRWWAFMILGIASVVVGVILLFSPQVAVGTLAVLVAFGLIVTGLSELTGSGRYRTAWSVAAGVALTAAGIVALAWPGITLWALAVVTALGLLISGGARMTAGWLDRPDGWGWLVVGGLLSVVVGLLALAWPGATVLVLAILLGLRMVIFGAAEIAFALALRDLRAR